ncbi:oligosaccharide translocation protein RFT1 [Verticillium dahliae]|nr:oligosaccharide translocation protein RFT1 [Verticillium dahliae]
MPSPEASPSSPADAPGTTTHAPPAAALLLRCCWPLPLLAPSLSLLPSYYLSVLFFARESLRVAIQRQSPSSARSNTPIHQAVVNLGYLAVILGCFVSVGLGALYLSSLLAEPIFVLMQTRLHFRTRASAESIATFLRCIVTFAAALSASRSGLQLGVLPFALGQLAYGLALLLVYLGAGVRLASTAETGNSFSLLPRTLTTEDGSGADYVWSATPFSYPSCRRPRPRASTLWPTTTAVCSRASSSSPSRRAAAATSAGSSRRRQRRLRIHLPKRPHRRPRPQTR